MSREQACVKLLLDLCFSNPFLTTLRLKNDIIIFIIKGMQFVSLPQVVL